MEGREIILPGNNVSEENDSIKELLIFFFDVILVGIHRLNICQIKHKNISVTKKTKAFKYGRFNKESTFFHESYLNLFDIVSKTKKNRHLCLS